MQWLQQKRSFYKVIKYAGPIGTCKTKIIWFKVILYFSSYSLLHICLRFFNYVAKSRHNGQTCVMHDNACCYGRTIRLDLRDAQRLEQGIIHTLLGLPSGTFWRAAIAGYFQFVMIQNLLLLNSKFQDHNKNTITHDLSILMRFDINFLENNREFNGGVT